jgi:hypothetical protein
MLRNRQYTLISKTRYESLKRDHSTHNKWKRIKCKGICSSRVLKERQPDGENKIKFPFRYHWNLRVYGINIRSR